MTKTVLITALIAIMTISITLFFVGSSADAEITHEAKVVSGTIQSMVDPGIGHESHQIAILLPPSENVYSGILTYSASEPIQLVALHGPLSEGEDNGQAIWTPDGETKFALTFVDNEASMGTWKFSGNVLAVHTMNTEPFTVSYSVAAYTIGGDTVELKEGISMDDDSTVDETMDEDDSMMDETVLRPRQQMESGIEPQDVVCKEGLLLILRTSSGSAACVTESSSTRLIDMGWGSLG